MIRLMRFLVLPLFVVIFVSSFSLCGFAEEGITEDTVEENETPTYFKGKEGWFFYNGDDTIADYQGTDLLTPIELSNIKNHLGAVRDSMALMGKEFVLFIAPNREQVYSQFMPDSYGELTDYTRAQQVTDYLRGNGFRVVYPINELKEAAAAYPQYDFYFKTDTHWNYLGAYVGTKALLAELGIFAPDISQIGINRFESIYDNTSGSSVLTRGDYELKDYSDNPVPVVQYSNDELVRTTNTGVDPRKVMIIGDSFSSDQIPFMGAFFDQVIRCPAKSGLSSLTFLEEQPDVVVYEIVERYVYLLESGFGLPYIFN